MKNYNQFKETVKEAVAILSQRGIKVTAKHWTKESPFQKARYKSEYVFPEVWLYPDNGGMGIVINAEEYNTPTKITDYVSLVA